jgi:murein DD-endopeptidase MepM/ murein hydrolase activator NlpD
VPVPPPDVTRGARIFTAGAAVGFLTGAFAVAAIVWQFGNVIGSRPTVAERVSPPAAVDRWGGEPVDSDSPVLEPETIGTAGTSPSGGAVRPAPEAAAPPTISAPPSAELEDRDFTIPVQGVGPDQLVRTFDAARGSRRHEAIDIMAPTGTPVLAVEAGTIARLFISKAGGITVYQFDPSERFCYYYAHLDRYAEGIREGDAVRKGQVIGYVGVSGNAPKDAPHLHFAIFRLTAEKRWWEGTPVDPYDLLR